MNLGNLVLGFCIGALLTAVVEIIRFKKEVRMITTVVKARGNQKYKPKIGDILYGEKWFESIKEVEDKLQAVLLGALAVNTWYVLEKLGVQVEDLKKEIEYTCPYLDHQFYWCMPVALCGDIEKYRANAREAFGKMYADYSFDTSFINHAGGLGENPIKWELSDVTRLWMGSGYTVGTLISDGSRGRQRVSVPLDNGDWIMVETWEWYNK